MALTETLKSFFSQSVRVWRVLKKPSKEEFKSIAKVSAIGILALGLFGFIFALIVNLL